MPRFEKGKSGNLKGCPKGAHNVGRPSSKVKALAKKRSLSILKRIADIAAGGDLEQAVTENGETIRIPAPIREQIKAGEIILKVADEMKNTLDVGEGTVGRMVLIFPEDDK